MNWLYSCYEEKNAIFLSLSNKRYVCEQIGQYKQVWTGYLEDPVVVLSPGIFSTFFSKKVKNIFSPFFKKEEEEKRKHQLTLLKFTFLRHSKTY